MKDLKTRLCLNEELDNLKLKGVQLERTLKSLSITNKLFGTHHQLNSAVLKYIKSHPKSGAWQILDLGCGGGDCIHSMNNYLSKHNIDVNFTGIDGNENSIAYAQKKRIDNTSFKTVDIFNNNLKLPKYDLIVSSHFIYHFSNSEVIPFINKLNNIHATPLIFSELRRSSISYYLFSIVRHVLPLSDLARRDGLIAIRRSFTLDEAHTLFSKTDYSKHSITSKPWFRMLIELY